ncbi:Peroxisome assembly protein 10 [Exophiala dermatitidis]
MSSPPARGRMEYPFAPSPDILRTHEKDAYMIGQVTSELSTIVRSLLGARVAHKYSGATNHLSELLYLCLTTLLGNRTLGEEYCDVIQVEDDTLRLAGLGRRVGYIASVVFAPWALGKTLPALRRRLRSKLERSIQQQEQQQYKGRPPTRNTKLIVQKYLLKHLDSLTSPSPFYAVSLATFYFTGAYYHISKRLFGLRYIFTKQIKPDEQRVGYEVLGVLLVLQLAVQAALHVRETYLEIYGGGGGSVGGTVVDKSEIEGPQNGNFTTSSTYVGRGIEVPVSGSSHLSPPNNETQLLDTQQLALTPGLATTTQTPILDAGQARYDLSDATTMAWIPDGQQRKCTLCLDPLRDPSATTCGHVFCWTCVQDWVKEKTECPLCRQSVLPQKILPLR